LTSRSAGSAFCSGVAAESDPTIFRADTLARKAKKLPNFNLYPRKTALALAAADPEAPRQLVMDALDLDIANAMGPYGIQKSILTRRYVRLPV
jgi:hypothetical protein